MGWAVEVLAQPWMHARLKLRRPSGRPGGWMGLRPDVHPGILNFLLVHQLELAFAQV